MPFCETLRRAIRIQDKDQCGYVVIHSKEGRDKVKTDDILYVESQGHRLTFITKQGKFETTKYSMKEIEQMLSQFDFRRCNSGCLVNLKYVLGYKGNEINLANTKISISRGKRNEFLAALTSYMAE